MTCAEDSMRTRLRDDKRLGSSLVLSAGGVQARCQARSTHPLI